MQHSRLGIGRLAAVLRAIDLLSRTRFAVFYGAKQYLKRRRIYLSTIVPGNFRPHPHSATLNKLLAEHKETAAFTAVSWQIRTAICFRSAWCNRSSAVIGAGNEASEYRRKNP
jgi:hypothetical protein